MGELTKYADVLVAILDVIIGTTFIIAVVKICAISNTMKRVEKLLREKL